VLLSFSSALAATWLAGCDDLDQFKTSGGQRFRGEVVGSDSMQGDSSFIRQGFTSHTQMELSFDPALAGLSPNDEDGGVGGRVGPGKLTTYLCPKGARSCAKSERTPAPFDGAPLLAIENLAHDALSEYSFPGGGRIRNYIFGARFQSTMPTGPVQRYAMVFLSLMENGAIEVRVLAPSVLAADGKTDALPPLFGVFVLERHKS
jgi:hypothetical protein